MISQRAPSVACFQHSSLQSRGAVQWRSARTAGRHRPDVTTSAGGVATQAAVQQLLDAIKGTERGVSTSATAKERIMAAVEELKRAGAGETTTTATTLVRAV
jgi:hypothetical protein